MRVIVPAAGVGERLRPLTNDRPKPLVEVAGRPLIAHALERLWRAGVAEVVCVTGYRGEELALALDRCAPRPPLRLVHNERFATTNSIVSLGLTRRWWDRDFCVVDADVLVGDALLARVLDAPRDALAVDAERPLEHMDMRVEVRDGRVRRLAKDLPASRSSGEFFGVSRWTPQGAAHLADAIDELLAAGRDDVWYEDAITGAAQRFALATVSALPSDWAEVDSPDDLPAAEALLAAGAA